MSWQTKSVMDQKLQFIRMWQSRNYIMKFLRDRFNISRNKGNSLAKRFMEEGEYFLIDKTKAITHIVKYGENPQSLFR